MKPTVMLTAAVCLRLAQALRKMTEAASPHIGADCILQAKLAQASLGELGIETRLVCGEAAWRVGPGDGDVIVHSPRISQMVIAPGAALPIHYWLQTHAGEILDLTTHSLRAKAASLDAMDGGTTAVEWCPEYLLVMPPRNTLQDVTMAAQAGVFYYAELEGLMARLHARGLGTGKVDPSDMAVLRMLLRNETIQLVGPNHARAWNPAACQALVLE